MINEIKKKEWHKKYKQTFINNGVDEKFAEDSLQAGMGGYDYDDDPVDNALDEMSY